APSRLHAIEIALHSRESSHSGERAPAPRSLPLSENLLGMGADLALVVASGRAELSRRVVAPTIGLALVGECAGMPRARPDEHEAPRPRDDTPGFGHDLLGGVASELAALVRSPAVGARPRDHAARPPAEPEGIDGSSFEESLGLASLAHAPSSELASIVGAPTVEGGLVCRDAADVIVARDDRRESGYPLHLERFGRDVRLGSPELADAVLSPAESHPLLGEAADVEGPHRELDEGAGGHPSRLGAL